jgi:hypothetical protein
MATTTSVAKTTSLHAKNMPQKVVKLVKARSARNVLSDKLNPVPVKKTERVTRSSPGTAGVAVKSKPSTKTGDKKQGKAPKAKELPARATGNATAAKVRSRTASASSAAAVKTRANEKIIHSAIVRALDGQEKTRIPDANPRLAAKNMAVAPNNNRSYQEAMLSPADIKVFQIYYSPEQKSGLDPDFAAYDNSGNSSRLFEFSVFTRLAQSNEVRSAKLWGAMSWKFGKKAGISGRQLKEEIIAHPGYDAYFCNPYPENEALYHNMWVQGELAHPNFMPLCAEVFEVSNLPTELLTSVQPSSEFSAANYFVANQSFWRAYIGFVSRVLISADKNLSPTAKRILYSSTADKFGAHAEASYIPFLVERLFTIFLRTDGKHFKTFKLALPGREKKDNVHLKLLAEMKDVACRTKSMWLAACWINYRNLYLSKIYGDSWTKTHLKHITPASISFVSDNAKPSRA